MDPNILFIIIGAAALIAGIIAGKLIFAKSTRKKIEDTELQARNILQESESRAETIRKEKELEAKEKFVQLKSAHDKEVNERNRKINEEKTGSGKRNNPSIRKKITWIARSKKMR